jgi:hypothetical protein
MVERNPLAEDFDPLRIVERADTTFVKGDVREFVDESE